MKTVIAIAVMICACLETASGQALTARERAILDTIYSRIGDDTNAIDGVLIAIGTIPLDRLESDVLTSESDPVFYSSYAHRIDINDIRLVRSFTTNDVNQWNATRAITNGFFVTNTMFIDTVQTNVTDGITNLFKFSKGLLYEVETLTP